MKLGALARVFTGSKGYNKDAEALEAQLREVKARNQHLEDMLHGAINMRGYLYRHCQPAALLGVFSHEWELRYFVLTGTTLRSYKSDRDASAEPRTVVDVQNCLVELEDSTANAQQWRFRIVEPGGNQLLRLAADNLSAAEQWVAALENAGLRVVDKASFVVDRDAAPRRTSDSANDNLASARMQDRWEVSSTDSELPEHIRRPRKRHSRALAGAPVDSTSSSTSAGGDNITSSSGAAAAGGEVCSVRPGHVTNPHTNVTRPPMVGSTPVHTSARYSYLSSDGVWAAKHDGLWNLAMVIIVVTNFRLILENLLKYGIRMNLIRYVNQSLSGKGNLPVVLAFPALLLFSLIALATERLALYCMKQDEEFKQAIHKKDIADPKAANAALAAQRRRNDWLIFILNLVNCTATLALPLYLVYHTKAEPGPGFLLTMCTVVVFMKLVSYAHCNSDLRHARRHHELRSGERGNSDAQAPWAVLKYPENLTVRNMLYFLAVPTLTYQINFPRSQRIRKRWLARRFGELAVFLGLLAFMVDQYMAPAIENSLEPISKLHWVRIAERVLKLALPNLYCWLCMFYCLFHLWLNILAELTCFGDREFYKDWWNAATVGDYWKLWNMPVHKWLLRTIYFPALRNGINRWWAMLLVFFVSGVFHELAVGVPLHMVQYSAFFGIMLQVPLISLTEALKKHLKSDTWGNYIFWITFCIVGQPVSLMLYYHDWVIAHRQTILTDKLLNGTGGNSTIPSF